MAVYFLRCRHLSRAKGARATRAAAYRAGERIRDERAGQSFDHSDRTDVAHKEVVIPTDLAGRDDMAWTQDRFTLWNAVEHASLRRNAHLAREWLVTLPSELTADQRAGLARRFAKELSDKYRCAVDLCVHLPRPGADARHHHAHLLMTAREVSPDGLGRRTDLEINRVQRQQRGLTGSARDEFISIREQWARMTNEALRLAGLSASVDHRSLAAQGLDREPTRTIPYQVFYQERRTGMGTAAGDGIRARYLERVQARLEGPEALARVIARQKSELRELALERSGRRKAESQRVRASQLTREELKAVLRERMAARREGIRQDPVLLEKQRTARRQNYRERMQHEPEKMREQRRQQYQVHAAEIRRKQRTYREAHREELLQKNRAYYKARKQEINLRARGLRRQRRAEQGLSKSSRTAEESAQRWKEYRDRNGPGPTAEDSARNWLASRESHGPGPTADESARNWLAFRERERLAGALESSDPPGHGEDREGSSGEADDDDRREPARKRDHDFSL